jgi:hypothetical protein
VAGIVALVAAASSAVRAALTGPVQSSEWLGVSPAALYLKTAGQPGVLAVLAHDAVRLPCALVLPSTSKELPLTMLAPGPASRGLRQVQCLVGDGVITWSGPAGPVSIRAVREWAPRLAGRGSIVGSALDQVRAALPPPAVAGLDSRLLAPLGAASEGAAVDGSIVARLLGRGPGLTPSGDDLLAGFLVGAHAFGVPAAGQRRAAADLAPAATTALSAALLWHAARGQCIDEVADLAAALAGRGIAGPATRRLLAVGHSSGAALAWGLVLAAECALAAQVAA